MSDMFILVSNISHLHARLRDPSEKNKNKIKLLCGYLMNSTYTTVYLIAVVFPILRPLFSFLSVNESSAMKDATGLIESLIHDRKNNSQSVSHVTASIERINKYRQITKFF